MGEDRLAIGVVGGFGASMRGPGHVHHNGMVNVPFGRGRLLARTRGKPLPPWAEEFDCRSWAQFFLKYVVSHEAVTCAIPGMGRPEHVWDNLAAMRGRLPDPAMRRRMEAFAADL